MSEISRAPASPSSSFVERVDVGFGFLGSRLRRLRRYHHRHLLLFLLLWVIIPLHLFNERIARRG
jgi:hypothetical protein